MMGSRTTFHGALKYGMDTPPTRVTGLAEVMLSTYGYSTGVSELSIFIQQEMVG